MTKKTDLKAEQMKKPGEITITVGYHPPVKIYGMGGVTALRVGNYRYGIVGFSRALRNSNDFTPDQSAAYRKYVMPAARMFAIEYHAARRAAAQREVLS